MTIRSVVLGVLLGLFISGFTYFNDLVIFQTGFIGNHLPIIVFGLVVVLLMVANPLLGMVSTRLPLRASEVAVVAALGLAVCGWPGSNLMRYFTGVLALPSHYERVQPSWQSTEVLTYVPGHPDSSNQDASGVLLNDGVYDPAVTDPLVSGSEKASVPWRVWWSTLRLWIGGSILLGVASLCLVLIVHPQWAHRELLAYPTVTFVNELAAREPGRLLPNITRSRLFWAGLIGVVVIHLCIGLRAWFPEFPEIRRHVDFTPLWELMPNARRVPHNWYLFRPVFYATVIGFAYLINTRVAASLGLSLFAWVLVGSVMISNGIVWQNDRFQPVSQGNALRFGAYLATALTVIYYGRRYYTRVIVASMGLKRHSEVPNYASWAMRLLLLSCIAFVGLLSHYGGLTILSATLLLGLLLIIFLVLTRINVETGLFYAQPDFVPAIMLAGIFGLNGLGIEATLVLLLASLVFAADPREAVMPYLANGLRLGEKIARAPIGRLGVGLGAMMVVGLLVAVIATLVFQYSEGVNMRDTWSNDHLPQSTFNRAALEIKNLETAGQLSDATSRSSWEQLTHIEAMRGFWPLVLTGFVLVAGCAFVKLRLPWWPIHPILFLVWGTYPASVFAASFLIGAVIKSAVIKIGGERSYHTVKPLMIGLIAGELFAAIAWNAVGWVYYLSTGLSPSVYRVLP